MPDKLRSAAAAFTFIELLVVVAIISLLIGIMLPTLSSARQGGQRTKCLTNMRRLATSCLLYRAKDNGLFPPVRLKQANNTTYVNEFGREKPRWQWFLGFEVGPAIQPPVDASAGWGDSVTRQMTNDFFVCPSLKGDMSHDIRNGAYGFNYQYLGNSLTNADGYVNFPVSENEIVVTDLTVLIADSRGASPDHGKHSYTLDPPRLAVEKNATKFGPSASDGPIEHSPVEARHLEKAAVAFVDGHAEAMRLQTLGYEVGPDNVVVARLPGESDVATNRLWTGLGADRDY